MSLLHLETNVQLIMTPTTVDRIVETQNTKEITSIWFLH